jgi:hypothetical protein
MMASNAWLIHSSPACAPVAPGDDTQLTLEQRLALFDPARHGHEAMASKSIGAEQRLGSPSAGVTHVAVELADESCDGLEERPSV